MAEEGKAHLAWYQHIANRRSIYILLMSWAAVGFFLPGTPAIIYSIATFLLVLRTRDFTSILFATLAMLIFSDSRSSMFSFAASAKVGVIVILLLIITLRYRTLEDKQNHLFRFFLPFLVFSVVASVWAQDPFTAFQKSISYLSIFFIIPLMYSNGRIENRLIGVELVYFLAGIMMVGLMLHFIVPGFTTLVGRYRGLLGNPNGLGIFLIVTFAVFYPVLRRSKEVLRIHRFHLLFYFLVFTSVFLTGSRTALLAITLFFVFNRLRRMSNLFTVIVFLSLILSYEYILLQLPNIIFYFGLEEYFRLDTLEGGSGRFRAWTFAWQRIQEVFFLGGGFSYTEHIFKLYQDDLSILGHQGNAHNSYLTIWLDTGLIGLIFFLIGLIRSITKSLLHSAYTLPIVYAVLFTTFFESWLSASLNPFTSLFLIALTIHATPEQEPASSNAD